MGKKWKRNWLLHGRWQKIENKKTEKLALLELELKNPREYHPLPPFFTKQGTKKELLNVASRLGVEGCTEEMLKREIVEKLEQWEQSYYDKYQRELELACEKIRQENSL